ncbi:MAG: DMT family transporter [OCS116 cluster bacterium]|uniref:EamA domain-containing protein n=1 Tax=OCS116 cluster bacterium TaxID=2030921 RepID=A0A2A4YZN4_9PROT|nr:DMT family transporter [OCS116 cluster bacterium]
MLKKFDLKSNLMILVFCLTWASAFAAAKYGLQFWPPFWFLATRFLLTSIFFFGLCIVFGRLMKISAKQLGGLVVLGLLNNVGYLGFAWYSLSLPGTPSGLAATIISANPVLVTLAQFIFVTAAFSYKKLFGVLLGFLGVAYILQSRVSVDGVPLYVIGLLCFGLLSFSVATFLFTRLNCKTDFWLSLAVQNMTGAVALYIPAFLFESTPTVWFEPQFVMSMFYLVVIIGLSFVIWFKLIEQKGTAEASSLHFIMPPLGLFYGWLVFDESIPAGDYIGLIPIVVGIYLVTHQKAKN